MTQTGILVIEPVEMSEESVYPTTLTSLPGRTSGMTVFSSILLGFAAVVYRVSRIFKIF